MCRALQAAAARPAGEVRERTARAREYVMERYAPEVRYRELTAWAAAAIFAIVNMLLKPLAMLVSCCLIVATFGLFVLIINTALLGATAWVAGQLNLSFTVDGFWSAFFGAVIISLVSIFASVAIRRRRSLPS